MAQRPKISLATLAGGHDVGASPSVESAREALGGRLATERGAGELVRVQMRRGGDAAGVVVCVSGESRDVWIGEGRFVRTSLDRLTPLDDPDPALREVAVDARRFATLREGDAVRAFRRDATTLDGVLAEKCRYGALVRAGEGVLAVSFRRVIPAPS